MTSCVVDCAVYVDGDRLPGDWSASAAVDEVRRRGAGFVWVGLYEPDSAELQDITEPFGLSRQAVRDALRTHRRPRLELFGDTLFAVLKTVHYLEHESPATANEIVETGEIMAFLGRDFIVTIRRGEHSGLRELRKELEAAPDRLQLGPAAVLHSITDRVVDIYLEVTDAVERDIDVIESVVFEPHSAIGAEQIYLMKREIVELRRAITPLAVPLRKLAQADISLLPADVRSYFRDVDQNLDAVSERVAAYDELLTTLVNATLSKLTLQQNADVRKISAWVAILAVPTMVAGAYGMNFDFMPMLRWEYGYPTVLLVILLVSVVLHRILKRRNWL